MDVYTEYILRTTVCEKIKKSHDWYNLSKTICFNACTWLKRVADVMTCRRFGGFIFLCDNISVGDSAGTPRRDDVRRGCIYARQRPRRRRRRRTNYDDR